MVVINANDGSSGRCSKPLRSNSWKTGRRQRDYLWKDFVGKKFQVQSNSVQDFYIEEKSVSAYAKMSLLARMTLF